MNKTKILDLLTGKSVWEYYQLYLNTQWFSQEEMTNYQISKLRKLLQHCYDNVPYYRKIIDERKIDILNFSSLDILKQFPLLTKEIIQENYKNFTPVNNNIIKGVKTTQTGGTTGNILFKRNDSNTRSSIWGSYKRYEDWMGLTPSDKKLILMGGHVIKNSIKQRISTELSSFLDNSASLDIYNTSNETIEKVIDLLENNQFSLIRSYPQFLFSVANKLEGKKMNYKIKAISTTAEPVMPEHRHLFKKIFHCDVFDQFGFGEIGGVAYECNKHEGLHIAEERVVIETNAQNELIVTDLDNYTMPFIRYWNADQAIISDKLCSCGRKSKLLKQIMGRTCDYVVGIQGQFLHWAYFWHLIFDSHVAEKRNLRKFQIVQRTPHTIVMRLVADPLSNEEIDFITSDIKKRLGNMEITINYEKDIENTATGKYRPVINHLL